MNNPYLTAFCAVRDSGELTPLLDAHDAERRAIETIERGLAQLDPSDLAAAARDFTSAEYARLGFPDEVERSIERAFGRDPADAAICDVTRSLLSVADVALGALRRELDRLTDEPPLVAGDVYPFVVEGLTYLAITGLLEKRLGKLRQESYIHTARGQALSVALSTTREHEALARLTDYEQRVRNGTLLPAHHP